MSELQYVERKVQLVKETNEIADAAKELIIELIRSKRDDGKLDGEELIAIASGLISSFPKAAAGFDLVDDELKSDPASFLLAWSLAGVDIWNELKKQPEPSEDPVEEIVEDVVEEILE